MTVKELIEKLKEFDENIEVIADTQDWGCYLVTKVIEEDARDRDWEMIKIVYLS